MSITYAYGHCGFGHFSNAQQLQNEREMRTSFRELSPKLVIVDQTLRGFYEMFGPTKLDIWVLVRATTRAWFVENVLSVLHRFPNAKLIATEPCVTFEEIDANVNPIVLWNKDDLLPRDELRKKFGVPTGWIGAVIHSGAPGEFDELFDMPEAQEHLADCDWIVKLNGHDLSNPARTCGARYLSGATSIVCAAGYNAFWEAHWLGYADRCLFVPLTGVRVIPEQEIRLEKTPSRFFMRENGAYQLAEKIHLKLAQLDAM